MSGLCIWRGLFFSPWVKKDNVIRVLFSSISSSLGALQCGAVSGFGSVFLTEGLLNLVATVNLDFILVAHLWGRNKQVLIMRPPITPRSYCPGSQCEKKTKRRRPHISSTPHFLSPGYVPHTSAPLRMASFIISWAGNDTHFTYW